MSRNVVLSTRATQVEAQLIRAAATIDSKSVNEWALPRLVEAARDRLQQVATVGVAEA